MRINPSRIGLEGKKEKINMTIKNGHSSKSARNAAREAVCDAARDAAHEVVRDAAQKITVAARDAVEEIADDVRAAALRN